MSSPATRPALAPELCRGAGSDETACCVLLALLAGWFYLWTAFQPAGTWTLTTKEPQSYYAFQAAGFRSGHLYLALDPHPALLALKDPYDPVANARYRVHDLTFFHGRYFMYFGVTPVILLFWPFAVLTGSYPSEPAAVALFCIGSVWAGMGLLWAVRRRYCPEAPSWALFVASACLAFATPLMTLVEGPQFYQVPITCAIFLQMLMFAAVYRALHSVQRRKWLAVSGVLFGLSLGARPNYLLSFCALLMPIAAGFQRGVAAKRTFWRLLGDAGATFSPALLCGVALLDYNHARFGQFGEFGMHYQLAGERFTELHAVSAAFIPAHYYEYLLSPGLWQSYFPFFSGVSGKPYGLLRYDPWTWMAVFSFLAFRRQKSSRRLFNLTVAVAAAANLTLLACFFGTTSRYPGDFAQATLLLAGIGALAGGERWSRGLARNSYALLVLFLSAGSILLSLAVFYGSFPDREKFLAVARAANWPSFAWRQNHHEEDGGLRLELRLPEHAGPDAQPLFETGRQPDQRDWLQIVYLSPRKAKLGVFHAGTGLFESHPFDIPADRHVVVDTLYGSLLPPFSYPVFSGWTREQYDGMRRTLRVSVNGEEVLRAALDGYESSPADLRIGRLAWFTGGMQQAFTGDVLRVERLPVVQPKPEAPAITEAAPIELTVYLRSGQPAGAEPLLLSGSGGRSDLIYLIHDGLNRVKFAFDHWGNGGPEGDTVAYDPLTTHHILLWMDSIRGEENGRLVVVFDGRTMLNTPQVFYPASPRSVVIGYNKYGSTSSEREFTGQIVSVQQRKMDMLPRFEPSGSYGSVEMSLAFPFALSGTNEPLVVTGKPGAGDFIYVRYLDANHLMFGFDHWGYGGLVGRPVEVNFGDSHRVMITFGALYLPGTPGRLSRRILVKLDGQSVLDGEADTYPSRSDQIAIGKNQIGGSTCGPTFNGKIFAVERRPSPEE